MADPARRLATFDDLLALGEDARAEVIDGVIVEKAAPSFEHGDAQASLAEFTRGASRRRSGGSAGWWLATEVEVELEAHQIFRPDVAGWRRDRHPQRPTGSPIRMRPDWIAEVLSPSNATLDLVKKFRAYQRNGVPHYWIVDPERPLLTVYRREEAGYLVVLQASRGETVRAEPFEDVELDVEVLFGE